MHLISSLQKQRESGQAMVEFVIVVLILVLFCFGLLDFARFLSYRQTLVNLSREGANLAARGIVSTNVVDTMVTSGLPLNITQRGRVILTEVLNTNGVYRIMAQINRGALNSSSRIGTVGGVANLPTTAVQIPPPTQRLYVAETFYTFTPITPVGRFIGRTLPSQVYDVAYFGGL